ncbi:MAG: hypothetical protein GX264_01035 [Clostridiales bacterium]|nr:hypothetical protein [Clostridiales bacterium]
MFYLYDSDAISNFSIFRESISGFVIFFLIYVSVSFLFSFIPMIIAYSRKHPQRQFIAILSFLIPPVGFIAALLWSMTNTDPEKQFFTGSRKNGGQQGPNEPNPRVMRALADLDSLYRSGFLTEEEYRQKRAEIIKGL